MDEHPRLMHTAIDAQDARGLTEFYRQFLGLHYRPGDEAPDDDSPDDDEWLVLLDDEDRRVLAVQRVNEDLPRSTWPSHEVPMQLHLDFEVGSRDELARQRQRALALGATELLDCTDEEGESRWVLADPAGHPFCLLTQDP